MAACDTEPEGAAPDEPIAEVSQSIDGPLGVVNVGSSAVTCVFNTSCTVTVSDTVGNIPLPGISGGARLQSRTFVGGAGAPAAGFHGYEYRVDLTNAVGITAIPCVSALRVAFGPAASFQYDGAGPLDQVYVVTSGGVGTIGLASAVKTGDEITFTFASPVCGGGHPGGGATSYFFGLASRRAPSAITAVVVPSSGSALSVAGTAPNLDKCTTGAALVSDADACVSSVCAADSFCCNVTWDAVCVREVRTVCGSLSCAESNGTCSHSLCATDGPLVNGCDSAKANCVSAICAADPFCCATGWDGICESEVDTVCGKNCD
jgi:hypothetical protein